MTCPGKSSEIWRNQREGPLKWQFLAISDTPLCIKNPEISKSDLESLGSWRSLGSLSYGQLLGSLSFWNSRMTSASVSLGQAGSTVILVAQISFVTFVLREEFALLFQTFSRIDPPGQAPLSRGRSVFKKKKKKKKRRKRKKGRKKYFLFDSIQI